LDKSNHDEQDKETMAPLTYIHTYIHTYGEHGLGFTDKHNRLGPLRQRVLAVIPYQLHFLPVLYGRVRSGHLVSVIACLPEDTERRIYNIAAQCTGVHMLYGCAYSVRIEYCTHIPCLCTDV
jgi:hypothetical protein